MFPEQFKSWRSSLDLTQIAAAGLLGVSRVTVQNWENTVTRIPAVVDAACEFHRRRWKMRPEYGPVTLSHFDAPLWQSPYGPATVPRATKELYPNNQAAIERACTLLGRADIHNVLITDESGDIVWNGIQLAEECKNQSTRLRRQLSQGAA